MILRVRSNLGTTKLEVDADKATESTVRARFLEDLQTSTAYYKLTQDLSFDPAGNFKLHPSKTLREQLVAHGTLLYCRVEKETTTRKPIKTPNENQKESHVTKKDDAIETVAEEQQQHESSKEVGNITTNQDDVVSQKPIGEEKRTIGSSIINSSGSQDPKEEKELDVEEKHRSTNMDDANSPKDLPNVVVANSETQQPIKSFAQNTTAPETAVENESGGMDTQFEKQVSPQGNDSLAINNDRIDVASSSIERDSGVVDKKADETALSHLFDGIWKMSWESCPVDSSCARRPISTIVSIIENTFTMFGFHCKIELGGPEENYNPRFKWARGFLSNMLIIPPGMQRNELPSHIEWTTTDLKNGKIIWEKLDDTSEEALVLRKEKEESEMMSTVTGKAWFLVEGAMSLQMEDIKIIAQDDIIFLTENLLVAWEDFKRRNIQATIDIAYHHTKSENLATIRTNGLLSREEQKQQHISSKYNGSKYGDGVYCTTDPTKHAGHFGDTTILLARMKGSNTINIEALGICVLESSSQCIPLFQFPSKLLAQKDFLGRLAYFQKSVQALLDKIFNQHNFAHSTLEIMHNIWRHRETQGVGIKLEMQRQHIRQQKRINIAKRMALHKKEYFEMFTHVLIKYIEQKDWTLHSQAKRIVRDCTDGNNVTISMEIRLKELVGEHHWEVANDYFFHFFYFSLPIEQEKKQASNIIDTTIEAPLTTLDVVEGDFVPPILQEQDREHLNQRQQQQQQLALLQQQPQQQVQIENIDDTPILEEQLLALLQQQRQQQVKQRKRGEMEENRRLRQVKQRKLKTEEENHSLREGINDCKKQINMLHDVVAKLQVRLDLDDTDVHNGGSERVTSGPSSGKKSKQEKGDNDNDDASDAAIYKDSSKRMNDGPSSGKKSKEEKRDNDNDNDDASDAAIYRDSSERMNNGPSGGKKSKEEENDNDNDDASDTAIYRN